MWQIIVSALCIAVIGSVFLRKLFLSVKVAKLGRMSVKKEHFENIELKGEDLIVSETEMIPDATVVDSKMRLKGSNLFKKGQTALRKGLEQDAEKLFIQAISCDPSNVGAYANLALLYLYGGQDAKAELIYRKLIAVSPEDVIYVNNLALSLFNQEKYLEAKENFEKAIEIDVSRAGRHYSLANTLYALGRVSEAIERLEKAIELEVKNSSYLVVKAYWLIEAGRRGEAEEVLMLIKQIDPKNEEIVKIREEIENISTNKEVGKVSE